MLLIADSGSTKTAWCVVDADSETYLATQGINPFQQTKEEISDVLRHELASQMTSHGIDTDAINEIYFYGAGCTAEKAPTVASALRTVMPKATAISVESDMLGAARGLCGDEAGIVCILGTGSNSCYYDGRDIVANVSPLGFILGDEGSGAYIGKRLVADVLKRQLPDDVCRLFFSETGITQATVIQRVYREPLPNRYLASLSPFCAKHRNIKAIHDLLIDCFTQFFRRNIDQYSAFINNSSKKTVHFVGSIAHHYRNELTEAATACGYTIGNIMQAPLEALVKYHRKT